MNVWDFIVFAIVVLIVIGAIAVYVRSRKNGRGCCNDCSKCDDCTYKK